MDDYLSFYLKVNEGADKEFAVAWFFDKLPHSVVEEMLHQDLIVEAGLVGHGQFRSAKQLLASNERDEMQRGLLFLQAAISAVQRSQKTTKPQLDSVEQRTKRHHTVAALPSLYCQKCSKSGHAKKDCPRYICYGCGGSFRLNNQNNAALDRVDNFLTAFRWTKCEKLTRDCVTGPMQKDSVNCGMFLCSMVEYILTFMKFVDGNLSATIKFLSNNSDILFGEEQDTMQHRRRNHLALYCDLAIQHDEFDKNEIFDETMLMQADSLVQDLIKSTLTFWKLCFVCQSFTIVPTTSYETELQQCTSCYRRFHKNCSLKPGSTTCHICRE